MERERDRKRERERERERVNTYLPPFSDGIYIYKCKKKINFHTCSPIKLLFHGCSKMSLYGTCVSRPYTLCPV